ncbi:hypothetical protein, partial [Pseudomonas alvandae]|uniref:hypothetical protein n=1 Tax=Pseudomonas canavaninivorans TaxID=2842348 RepID=UPI002B1DB9CC
YLLGGGASEIGSSPDDPALIDSIHGETFAVLDNACADGLDPTECARIRDGRIASRVTFIGEYEMARGYSAGQIMTGRKIGARKKKWLPTLH